MLKMLKNVITRLLNRMGYRLNRIEAPFRPAMPLKKEHIQNCRLVTNRDELLKYMPKQSICAEIGIAHGNCSAKILSIVDPGQLHLIDNNNEYIEHVRKRFSEKIGTQVFLHCGDSFSELMKFQDGFFDWIYIDANHSYDYVKKDLDAARLKVNDRGLIVLNDYIFFDHALFMKYGVIEAVNEFCNKYSYEILFFALQEKMFNDVALRKIGA